MYNNRLGDRERSERRTALNKVYIILEDGHVFEGEGFGAVGETLGELVFSTSVVGYVEALSDPCYAGQIVLHTFPLMGNVGWIEEDMRSSGSYMKGIIVREWCDAPSNFRAGETLDSYLKKAGIVGVSGVDTREITQILRDKGVMNAMITSVKPEGVPETVKNYSVEATVPYSNAVYEAAGEKRFDVTLIDCGANAQSVQELTARGCRVSCVPCTASADEIAALGGDAFLVSEGPGNPADYAAVVETIRALMGTKPMFGIGLGHQLMALAAGGKTEKLKYGHRGGNQPAKELASSRTYITAQNHGYVVTAENLAAMGAELSYVNANDGSCEGLVYPDKQAFSLQFHPENFTDSRKMAYDFDKFISMMGGDK